MKIDQKLRGCIGFRYAYAMLIGAVSILSIDLSTAVADDSVIGSPQVYAPGSVTARSAELSGTYTVYCSGAFPVLKDGEVIASENWHWTPNCSPQDGSATVTVTYNSSGQASSVSTAGCYILWSIAKASTGKVVRTIKEYCSANTTIAAPINVEQGSLIPESAPISTPQVTTAAPPVVSTPAPPAPVPVAPVPTPAATAPQSTTSVPKPSIEVHHDDVIAAPNTTTGLGAVPAIPVTASSPAQTTSPTVITGTASGADLPNPTIELNAPQPPALTTTAPITLPSYQEAAGPDLSIDQAVQIATAQSTQVINANLALNKVKYEVKGITGEAFPQVSISASDTYSNRDSSPGGVSSGQTNLSTSGLQIPQITDAQSGSTGSTVSTAQTASTSTSTSSGGGSSTTTSSVTLVPVTGPAGGSSSSSTADARLANATTATSTTSPFTGSSLLSNFTSTPYRLNNYGAKLSLSQIVDINGLVSTSEKLLDNEVTFYNLDLRRIENEVAYNTKSQYYAVLRAEQQLKTDQEQVTNTQAELTDAQNRYNAGTSPAFDVVSAQTNLSTAQQSLIDAEITVQVQRATLNNILNRPIDTPFTTTTPVTPNLPTSDTDSAEIAVAEANRPELLQADIAIEIANKLVKLDRVGLLPQMALSAALVYNGYASFPNGLGTTSNITAAVTLPLFDGGQTAALVHEAKDDLEQQRVTKEQLTNGVALEVRSAFVNVKDGTALVDANTQGVAEARESLRLANIRYKAGTGTLLEVTNAEANLAVAETNLSTAQFQLFSEYASLLRSEGLR